MNYRRLGKTGLMVSEIGFGAEWMERHTQEECIKVIDACERNGINILDCWMSEPNVRTNIGVALRGRREKWYIQGHIGSTWQNGQYVRTRQMDKVKEAFEDLLTRLETDYIDLGMIHYVDQESDWNEIINGPFIEYVRELKNKGIIRHIGMSTHNPLIAKKAVLSGVVEMILFSINPAFDILPASEDIKAYFVDEYDASLGGIAPERAELYKLCEQYDVGITVMKGFAGGRLFDEKRSPFGVALTPIQCVHYCLTRPAVTAVMAGFDTPEQVDDVARYETASEAEKDYASVLAKAPRHAYSGQCTYCGHCKPCPMDIDIAMVNKLYDLATMQPEMPASVKAHYEALDNAASKCI
ncbi:MAG: aldo/keto reductase, partial [Clostridia bacterium]|nr:aldo/keto reductase [Clostridia bacterium]